MSSLLELHYRRLRPYRVKHLLLLDSEELQKSSSTLQSKNFHGIFYQKKFNGATKELRHRARALIC